MSVTRLAAVFNVNPEQASAGFATAIRTSPIANTSEGNLVCRRLARQRTSAAISANTVNHCFRPILARLGVEVRVQASAIQRIEEASMEVTFQTALDVPDVRPPAVDAGLPRKKLGKFVSIEQTLLPTGAPT